MKILVGTKTEKFERGRGVGEIEVEIPDGAAVIGLTFVATRVVVQYWRLAPVETETVEPEPETTQPRRRLRLVP